MPDNSENAERSGYESSALGLGERLRSARKARALSVEQVAETLHLDESVVLALEDERFDTLGAAVFVRGHLKAYARCVGMSEESVLQAYQPAEESDEVMPRVQSGSNRPVGLGVGPWGFALVLGFVGVGSVLYLLGGEEPNPIVPDRPSLSIELTEGPDVTDANEQLEVKAEPNESVAPAGSSSTPGQTLAAADANQPVPEGSTAIQKAPAVESEAPATALPPVAAADTDGEVGPTVGPADAAGTNTLAVTLVFGQESWAEISDPNRRLLFGLQRPGVRRELTGDPPIQVLLGNARAVSIFVNDAPYTIPERRYRGNVARFEIGAAREALPQ